MRSVLIVAETMLAVVLLVGAGLLARSFSRLLSVDLGFTADAVQTFTVTLPDSRYGQPLQRQEFIERCSRASRTNPAVESAGAVFGSAAVAILVTASRRRRSMAARCRDDEQDALTLQIRLVTPDYFKTMGNSGRARDAVSRPPIAWARAGRNPQRRRRPRECGRMRNRWVTKCSIGTRFGLGGEQAGGISSASSAMYSEYGPGVRRRRRRCTCPTRNGRSIP